MVVCKTDALLSVGYVPMPAAAPRSDVPVSASSPVSSAAFGRPPIIVRIVVATILLVFFSLFLSYSLFASARRVSPFVLFFRFSVMFARTQ